MLHGGSSQFLATKPYLMPPFCTFTKGEVPGSRRSTFLSYPVGRMSLAIVPLFRQFQAVENFSTVWFSCRTEANCSLFLVCRVSVTFIHCSIFSPMVWALSNPPHTNKLNTRVLLSAFFLFLLLEVGYIFNFRCRKPIGCHENHSRRKKKLRLSSL